MSKPASPFSQRIDELINFDKRIFFMLLVLLYLVIRYITNDIILKAIPGYEQLEQDGTFTFFHIFNALNYLWTPFALLWKFTVTAFVIWVGSFALGFKVSYRKLWQFVLVSEIIFLFPELIKLIIFIAPADTVTFQEIRDYYPLSLFSMVNPEEVPAKFHYPLRSLNFFELAYCFLLTLGFQHISRRSIQESTVVILCSYVFFLLLWLGFYVLVYKS